MSKPRINPDGSLSYPQRGNPPPIVQGYRRDPGDAYRLVLEFPECPFLVREERRRRPGCNKIIVVHSCAKGYNPSHDACTDCIKSGRRDS